MKTKFTHKMYFYRDKKPKPKFHSPMKKYNILLEFEQMENKHLRLSLQKCFVPPDLRS